MEPKQFYTQLGGLSLGLGLLLLLQNWVPDIYPHRFLSWGLWLFFVLFSVIIYIAASRAAQSRNVNDFSSVVLGVIFAKMLAVVVTIVAYSRGKEFDSLLFLIPFFGIYVVFTIFEVYFMTRLGRTKN